ncbi:MAG: YbaB/EbfC family nucleoid-associated protein [Leptospirillum sp.]
MMPDFMKKAQELQEKMAKIQEEAGSRTVQGSAGGQMVTVTVNGRMEVTSLHIEPQILKNEEPSFVEDLIVAALNDGLKKAKDLMAQSLLEASGLPPGLSGGFPGF